MSTNRAAWLYYLDCYKGSKLRLAGRGLPTKMPGDFFVVLQIVLPPATTDQAKEVYQNMQQALDFNPRQSMGG